MTDARRRPARYGEALAFYHANLYVVTKDCKIWPFATTPAGYGKVQLNGKLMGTHHLACLAWHGPPPPKTEAAHGECHNPLCWNGAHLSWETRKTQQQDRLRDGTHQLGEQNPVAKFTNETVRLIRQEKLTSELTQRDLCRKYQVSEATMSRIINNKAYT